MSAPTEPKPIRLTSMPDGTVGVVWVGLTPKNEPVVMVAFGLAEVMTQDTVDKLTAAVRSSLQESVRPRG
jgi:hypothetical protein